MSFAMIPSDVVVLVRHVPQPSWKIAPPLEKMCYHWYQLGRSIFQVPNALTINPTCSHTEKRRWRPLSHGIHHLVQHEYGETNNVRRDRCCQETCHPSQNSMRNWLAMSGQTHGWAWLLEHGHDVWLREICLGCGYKHLPLQQQPQLSSSDINSLSWSNWWRTGWLRRCHNIVLSRPCTII